MASWDINPSVVNQVVGETRDAADALADALEGSADGRTLGVGSVSLEICAKAQSSLLALAVQSYFDDQRASISQVLYRVSGVMGGTVSACNAIDEGHQSIAEDIQARMAAACGSGDFTGFLPDIGG